MVWCRVTRHPRIFCELTGCQWTPGIWGVTKYLKWSFNSVHNAQPRDKISQPYPMVGCLKTCYKLCCHGGRSYECLLSTLLRNSSSSKHVDIARSGSSTILTSGKIGIRIANDLQLIRFSVCEHKIFCSL